MRKIFDYKGSLIAIYDEQGGGRIRVFSPNMEYLGEVNDQGTFDKNKSLITRSKEPGLLVERS
jgi:hypothetical protein